MHHLAAWRREHPSALERKVIAWLDAHGVAYTREVYVAGQWVDFIAEQHTTVIEVDGDKWHRYNPLHDQDRLGMDTLKQMALASAGYLVLRLSTAAITSGAAFTLLSSHFNNQQSREDI
jgi:very-short-patch-repair endonuclease